MKNQNSLQQEMRDLRVKLEVRVVKTVHQKPQALKRVDQKMQVMSKPDCLDWKMKKMTPLLQWI